MLGSYVAFNLLPSDPCDLLASCIVSLTQRINKYVCMYVCMIESKTMHSLTAKEDGVVDKPHPQF